MLDGPLRMWAWPPQTDLPVDSTSGWDACTTGSEFPGNLLPGRDLRQLFYRNNRRKPAGSNAFVRPAWQIRSSKGSVWYKPDRIRKLCWRVWFDSSADIFGGNWGILASSFSAFMVGGSCILKGATFSILRVDWTFGNDGGRTPAWF